MGIVQSTAVAWTSNSSGAASGTITSLNGVLLAVTFYPGAATPTTAYDVVVTDAYGVDILGGTGANISSSAAVKKCPLIAGTDGVTTTAVPGAVAGDHTYSITNAGSAKNGTLVFYTR